jgi:hypothetical protein
MEAKKSNILFLNSKERAVDTSSISLKPSNLLLLFFVCCNSSQRTIPLEWKIVNEHYFEFMVPRNMNKIEVQGIDSFVGRYKNESIDLSFDYGGWSDKLNDFPEGIRDFQSVQDTINGRRAKIVSYSKSDSRYFMAVHFPEPGLTMYSATKSEIDLDTMARIFQSIRFLRSQ